MKQVASETKSCRNALIDDARDQIALGKKKNETTTGPYCKARQRLLEDAIKSLLQTSGKNLDNGTHKAYLWQNRRVVLADGSKLSMPDTEANQAEYPQPKSQKKELGFPQLRIMVLIALGSGALLDSAVAACEGKGTGEQALLRKMLPSLDAGDVLLADANFENYFLLVQLLEAGIDVSSKKTAPAKLTFGNARKSWANGMVCFGWNAQSVRIG